RADGSGPRRNLHRVGVEESGNLGDRIQHRGERLAVECGTLELAGEHTEGESGTRSSARLHIDDRVARDEHVRDVGGAGHLHDTVNHERCRAARGYIVAATESVDARTRTGTRTGT